MGGSDQSTRTQVAIVGGGPSGLLLGQLLHRQGIETVILERQTRDHVLGRIRAGILEKGTASLMREAGVADRMERECLIHDGIMLSYGNDLFEINFRQLIQSFVIVYGQTELTYDLYHAREASDAGTVFDVEEVRLHDLDRSSPYVTYRHRGQDRHIDCDFIAGCDGFHGVSRQSVPQSIRREYEKVYPFGWLGILSETPPVNDELIYASSERGFALCSMRNPNLSRYYIQCALSDTVHEWSDDDFWDELRRRIPAHKADALVTGPSIEKSIAPLRSFVTEPMHWGRLFLCGDAAHIVPPTGAKGLNTAVSDVHYLYRALIAHFQEGDDEGLDRYSEHALLRVWKAERFSWWFTNLMHRFPDQSQFDMKMQRAEITFLRDSTSAQTVMAQNYVGLPY